MRSQRDERGLDERGLDERGLDEPADDLRRPPAAGGRSFADREVPIVPEGEPSRGTDTWGRLTAAMAARRMVLAPVGLRGRIMAAINELPLA